MGYQDRHKARSLRWWVDGLPGSALGSIPTVAWLVLRVGEKTIITRMLHKKFHIGIYEYVMLLLVLLASTLRVILISQHWPVTNSDEAIMDLMALHINNRGEHPLFFYGQAYMGPIEAYVGALCFRLFGESVFSLRLGLIPFFALFLISLYFLARKLYNRQLALFTVALLCLGSSDMLVRQLRAIGGYPEIPFFGAFIFFLCCKLALSDDRKLPLSGDHKLPLSGDHKLPLSGDHKLPLSGDHKLPLSGDRKGRDEASSSSTLRGIHIPPIKSSSPFYMRRYEGQKGQWWPRWLQYGVLGLLVGLAVWIDQLVAPYIATGLLLLLVFCWRDFFSRYGLVFALGVIVGILPLIAYDITAPLDQNFVQVLLNTHKAGQQALQGEAMPFLRQLTGTFLISLPTMTGFNPVCTIDQFPFFGMTASTSWSCVVAQGRWSLGYLLLWIWAFLMACISLWKLRRQRGQGRSMPPALTIEQVETRQQKIVYMARLLLLVSALLTLLQYLGSPASGLTPNTSARYLDCMLISTPALLWPLWSRISRYRERFSFSLALVRLGSICLLLFIGGMFLAGTIRIVLDIPNAQNEYSREQALMQTLLDAGVTRFYSEYWTCNHLIFRSDERLVCSNLNGGLQADAALDRYQPYRDDVRESRVTTYVFPEGSSQQQSMDAYLQSKLVHYTRRQFRGYVIYQMAMPIGIP